ncbi:MAG: acetate kinase [Gammaproteobacteria bacterium MedPE]|nr:MAG: acetate kinase [Gammaproteobacteria bacterium MedPE]
MEKTLVFVLNCGSSSLKFSLIDSQSHDEVLSGLGDALGSDAPLIKYKYQGNKQTIDLPASATHQIAVDTIVTLLADLSLTDAVIAVGHRVVHGGELFTQSVVITDHVLSQLEQLSKLAPLHNPANIIGIKAASQAFPSLKQIAVFDTAFHQTMPEKAYIYALPRLLYKDHGIRRYGFHGTSHLYITQQAAAILDKPQDDINIISAHLGNGASVTAIKSGKSVDTSMGLTPLEGLVMGTRCGDLDPAISQYMIDQLDYTNEQVNDIFNKKSGLLGLSDISNDCRIVEERAEKGDALCKLAIDVFCYRLAKYIASYTVPLGRLDALVFTGGIGENSDMIRTKVIEQLTIFGFEVDAQANLSARFGKGGKITTTNSPIAMVIPTNEELVIALDAISLIEE